MAQVDYCPEEVLGTTEAEDTETTAPYSPIKRPKESRQENTRRLLKSSDNVLPEVTCAR